MRMIDAYCREVFTDGLSAKRVLGNDLSTISFSLVLRDFVSAFHDAAPSAMTFTQAMTNATVLLAREQAMTSYAKKMDAVLKRSQSGLDPEAFTLAAESVEKEVKEEYE